MFGDGDGNRFDAMVDQDIVAHEFAHAITASTSGLIFEGEPGALNEGLSDIWAAIVEYNQNVKNETNYLTSTDDTLSPVVGVAISVNCGTGLNWSTGQICYIENSEQESTCQVVNYNSGLGILDVIPQKVLNPGVSTTTSSTISLYSSKNVYLIGDKTDLRVSTPTPGFRIMSAPKIQTQANTYEGQYWVNTDPNISHQHKKMIGMVFIKILEL